MIDLRSLLGEDKFKLYMDAVKKSRQRIWLLVSPEDYNFFAIRGHDELLVPNEVCSIKNKKYLVVAEGRFVRKEDLEAIPEVNNDDIEHLDEATHDQVLEAVQKAGFARYFNGELPVDLMGAHAVFGRIFTDQQGQFIKKLEKTGTLAFRIVYANSMWIDVYIDQKDQGRLADIIEPNYNYLIFGRFFTTKGNDREFYKISASNIFKLDPVSTGGSNEAASELADVKGTPIEIAQPQQQTQKEETEPKNNRKLAAQKIVEEYQSKVDQELIKKLNIDLNDRRVVPMAAAIKVVQRIMKENKGEEQPVSKETIYAGSTVHPALIEAAIDKLLTEGLIYEAKKNQYQIT